MYMDIREYKENYHRIKEIYNTVASPMDAVQQIIQNSEDPIPKRYLPLLPRFYSLMD